MMKSYVTMLQGLYTAIFSDLAVQFPSIRNEFIRDHTRIRSTIEARGSSYCTIDLPDQGKHFDKCLAAQRLTPFPGPNSRSWIRGGVVPKLFRGLHLRVFDFNGSLRQDADVSAIKALRQLYYVAKKLKMECKHERTWKSVRSFVTIDRGLRLPTLSWSGTEVLSGTAERLFLRDGLVSDDSLLPLFDDDTCNRHIERDTSSTPSYGFIECVQSVADIVSSSFGWFDPSEWRAKHGPGAVSDLRGKGVLSKYSFPYWPDKLENSFPSSLLAFANFGFWAENLSDPGQCGLSLHEPPSSLVAVPKTQKSPRLIASEPVAHQWCQQIILSFLSDRLRTGLLRNTVHIRDQSYNRSSAREASITGSHATIDLSDASDRLSCWTVERMLRGNTSLLDALHSSRTRWVSNKIDHKSPEYIILRKFACMGSACTFPIQSIIFAICAISSLIYARGLRPTEKNILRLGSEVQVYGDDIIIPVDGVELLQGLLGFLQLKVNPHKTHSIGRFRESCGLDAFMGNDVTPVYASTYPERARPESVISCVEVSNNFFKKGYCSVATWMKSIVLDVIPFGIPSLATDSGAFGWKFGYAGDIWPHKMRWNKHLHVHEAKVLRPKVRTTKLPDHSPRSLLQFFTEEPDPTILWESGVPSRRPAINFVRTWENASNLGLLH